MLNLNIIVNFLTIILIKVIIMKEMEKREIELLADLCIKNNIPIKLARDLLNTAKKFSYENVSDGARLKEYEEFIEIYMQKNK